MEKYSCWNKLRNHVRYCFSVVSIHGFNHVAWPGVSIFERLFWIVVLTASITTAIIQGLEIWQRFQERPTVITMEMDRFATKLEFPSTTVCFREPASSDKPFKKFIEKAQPEVLKNYSDKEIKAYMEDLAFEWFIDFDRYEKYANGSFPDILDASNYGEAVLNYVKKIEKVKRNFPMDYPLQEERPFYPTYTEYGVCTVVNPDIAIYYTPDFFNNSNPYYNYSPVIYDFQSTTQFTLKIETRTRVLVFFHPPNEALILNDGMYSSDFQHYKYSDISVINSKTLDEAKQLGIKQRSCKLPEENEGLRHSPKYSYNLCRMECRINLCLKHCNCTPYYYRRLSKKEKRMNYNYPDT